MLKSNLFKILFLLIFLVSCARVSQETHPNAVVPENDDQSVNKNSVIEINSPGFLNNIVLKLNNDAPFTSTVLEAFDLINTNSNLFNLLAFKSSEATSIKIIDSYNSGDGSEYNVEEKQLILSKADCNNNTNAQISKVFVGVFIHEIGHSVLRRNFSNDLSQEIELTKDNDKKRFKLIFKNQPKEADLLPQSLSGILSPFDELLADTYTVLLSENPKAISTSYVIGIFRLSFLPIDIFEINT